MIELNLSRGKMIIEVEPVDNGFQRVARYYLKVGNLADKILTHRSKRIYKTFNGAMKEASNFADQQNRMFNA